MEDYRNSHLAKGADYDRALAAGNFDSFMAARESELLDEIIPNLFADRIPRYLDFACGTGRITQQLEAHAIESFGLDISEKMVEQARQKCARTNFFVGDFTQGEPPVTGVNLVTSFRFFGNAQPGLRTAALRAINRMLVDRGYLVINNHRNPNTPRQWILRARGIPRTESLGWLTFGELESLLSDAGFETFEVHGIGVWAVLARFERPQVLESRVGRSLERLSELGPLTRISPDAVIVARKVRELR
jgi:SAM-dependent methyltransferase